MVKWVIGWVDLEIDQWTVLGGGRISTRLGGDSKLKEGEMGSLLEIGEGRSTVWVDEGPPFYRRC